MTGVTKLLKAHVKIRSFLWVTVNVSRRNLLVSKLLQGKIYNTMLMLMFIALYL